MRAFLYCRVAHDDSFALEHQRFLLQLYAKQAGYTIIGAADEYGSGLTLDRPALQKVTEAVVAGRVDVVLVHSLTRIGREWGMTQSYIDLLTRHKVKLLCIRDRLLFDENGFESLDDLGEFDFCQGSGWMYSINGLYSSYGFNKAYVQDGDTVRIRFTLAYGKDIGGYETMAGTYGVLDSYGKEW